MHTTIRSAVPDDADLLATLSRFIHDLHSAARPDDFKPLVPAELAEWFRKGLLDGATKIWIAECDGRPVGYVAASVQDRGATPFGPERRWLELDGISIDPDYRRRGVGRALVLAAVEHARAEGISRIEAVNWWFNDEARTAFARLGFEPKHVRIERST